MAELKDQHFEVIDSNKARAYEEQKAMREELTIFIQTCNIMNLQELHSEMKRMKRNRK